jgi:CRP/FNR family transcriptional regulator, cyclic AMP receptor protein
VGVGKTILKITRNQHLFELGDVAGTTFYIQKVRVKLTVLSEHGKEAVVAILEPGQFFGEGCFNGHSLRIATTTAIEECGLTSITKEAMIAALRSEPKFSELFLAYLLTRNSRIEEDLTDQPFLIQARGGSHAFFCSRISERKACLSPFHRISVRKRWSR